MKKLEGFLILFLHFALVPMTIFLTIIFLLTLLSGCTAGAPPPKIDLPQAQAPPPYSLQPEKTDTDIEILRPTDKVAIGLILLWRNGGRTQHMADGAVAIHTKKGYIEWLQDGFQYRTNRPGLYQHVPILQLKGHEEKPKESPKGRIVHNIKVWDLKDDLVVNVNVEGTGITEITEDGRIRWERIWRESGEERRGEYGTLPGAEWLIMSYYLQADIPLEYEIRGGN